MKNSLILHCGGHGATLDQVADVRTPAPTDTHYPIPHLDLYQSVQHRMIEAGYTIKSEAYALHDRDGITGANFFALLELETADQSHALVVGVRNSHTYQYAAGLVMGSRVFVCDNLSFSGSIKLARKHTRYISRDLPQLVAAGVGRLHDLRMSQAERFALYQGRELSIAEYDHAIVEMLRARAMPSSDIPRILKEIDKPSHREHLNADGAVTVWTLYNAFTEVAKGGSVFTLPKRTDALHAVCDGVVNYTPSTATIATIAERVGDMADAEIAEAA